jgi:Glycoside hydrolase family 44
VVLIQPSLDWVAKDAHSYSYPKTLYPDQQKFGPDNSDAGNGLLPDGSRVLPAADPTVSYTSWNATMAENWLKGLTNRPDIAFVDNEMDITHHTVCYSPTWNFSY